MAKDEAGSMVVQDKSSQVLVLTKTKKAETRKDIDGLLLLLAKSGCLNDFKMVWRVSFAYILMLM